jgi:hypothetical protein
MLEESGMKLRHPPLAPRGRQWALAALGTVLPDWEPYLGLAAPARDVVDMRDAAVLQFDVAKEGAAALSA